MHNSRRLFLAGLIQVATAACFGQGMATRKSRALPRSTPSGLPFNARFTDIASHAGLPTNVYGGVGQKKYIVESLGCGCAFFDYDNDGWLDIFLLSGTRLGDHRATRLIDYSRIIATGPSPTLPNRRGYSKRVGLAEFVSETTTTTVTKICSSPIGA